MRLTDLLAILLELAVLAGLILPKIDATSSCLRYDRAQSEISTLQGLLDRFALDSGRYPITQEGLRILASNELGLKGWEGPYSDHPLGGDPWGRPYLYRSNGKTYVLISWGADGEPGGEGDDADLTVPERCSTGNSRLLRVPLDLGARVGRLSPPLFEQALAFPEARELGAVLV